MIPKYKEIPISIKIGFWIQTQTLTVKLISLLGIVSLVKFIFKVWMVWWFYVNCGWLWCLYPWLSSKYTSKDFLLSQAWDFISFEAFIKVKIEDDKTLIELVSVSLLEPFLAKWFLNVWRLSCLEALVSMSLFKSVFATQ